jgi:hypothetical protein
VIYSLDGRDVSKPIELPKVNLVTSIDCFGDYLVAYTEHKDLRVFDFSSEANRKIDVVISQGRSFTAKSIYAHELLAFTRALLGCSDIELHCNVFFKSQKKVIYGLYKYDDPRSKQQKKVNMALKGHVVLNMEEILTYRPVVRSHRGRDSLTINGTVVLFCEFRVSDMWCLGSLSTQEVQHEFG